MNFQQLLGNLLQKLQSTAAPGSQTPQGQMQNLMAGHNGAAPIPNGQGMFAGGGQNPSYLQGAVNEYMRQQNLRKQQEQLNQQKKALQKQKAIPPQAPPTPPGNGAPPAQINAAAPFMQLFSSLMSKLHQ